MTIIYGYSSGQSFLYGCASCFSTLLSCSYKFPHASRSQHSTLAQIYFVVQVPYEYIAFAHPQKFSNNTTLISPWTYFTCNACNINKILLLLLLLLLALQFVHIFLFYFISVTYGLSWKIRRINMQMTNEQNFPFDSDLLNYVT